MSTTRQKEIYHWLAQVLQVAADDFTLTYMAGDASFRFYARVLVDDQSYILMDAPPQKENSAAFISMANIFKHLNVRVPHIIAQKTDDGFILLEDFGDELLAQHLNANTVVPLYQQALAQMLDFQQFGRGAWLPIYTEEKLLAEMQLFTEWFIPHFINHNLLEDEKKIIDDAYAFILNSVQQQPYTLVHRDYHSRNLMVLPNTQELGIIDFQDAVHGPLLYDAVSLLRDAYVEWDDSIVNQLVEHTYTQALQTNLITPDVTLAQFNDWFNLIGAQRHLKVLGIFVRLAQRDGKAGYLANMPLVFQYLVNEIEGYSELNQFKQWLLDVVLPMCQNKHKGFEHINIRVLN